jgi:hypothetical protein
MTIELLNKAKMFFSVFKFYDVPLCGIKFHF